MITRVLLILPVACLAGCFAGSFDPSEDEGGTTDGVESILDRTSDSGTLFGTTGEAELDGSSSGELSSTDLEEPLADVPTYAEVQDVFRAHCSCHSAGLNAGKGGFKAVTDYNSFLSYDPVGSDDLLVFPGQPEYSYLIQKLDESAPPPLLGARMPSVSLSRLNPEGFDIVYRWVEGGAPGP